MGLKYILKIKSATLILLSANTRTFKEFQKEKFGILKF